MASLELDRFRIIMSRFFGHYSDEIWGPIHGPGGPYMTTAGALEPDPLPWRGGSGGYRPWRELVVAFEAVKLAEALELATAGSGVAFLQTFSEDPDGWCGTRVPGHPPPKADEERLDPVVLSAALDFVARGVGHEPLAESVREIGNRVLG